MMVQMKHLLSSLLKILFEGFHEKTDEKREILYVIRTMDVLMTSGVGLEAALHTIGSGGYGIISQDFSQLMEKLRSGKSRGLELR